MSNQRQGACLRSSKSLPNAAISVFFDGETTLQYDLYEEIANSCACPEEGLGQPRDCHFRHTEEERKTRVRANKED